MLKIPGKIVDAIIEQARREAPVEACGYLAGKGKVVYERYEMTNADASHEHFSLDPKEQFAMVKESRSRGLEILAVYHSHPETPARPSEEDIRLAYDPDIIYVIVSLQKGGKVVRAFNIRKGIVEEVPVSVEV
ncbi:MAG: M67 family metallopeptidase [Candidatus Omnitrophota bacterium]|jgi:proteasome lid subunit RPN8/RPN11